MTIIEGKQFHSKSYKQLYNFLFSSYETEYEIFIPRRYTVQKDGDVFIAIDFNIAAYTGYMLSKCADCFSYTVPSIFHKEPFYFYASIKDCNKRRFAEVLYSMIQAFNPRDTCSMLVALDIESHEFLYDLTADEVYRISTFGLYRMVFARLSAADEEARKNNN